MIKFFDLIENVALLALGWFVAFLMCRLGWIPAPCPAPTPVPQTQQQTY